MTHCLQMHTRTRDRPAFTASTVRELRPRNTAWTRLNHREEPECCASVCLMEPGQKGRTNPKFGPERGQCEWVLHQANLPPAASTPADVLTCVYPQVDLEVMRGAEGFATVGAVLG